MIIHRSKGSKKILHIVIKSSLNGATVYALRLCDQLKAYDQEILSCYNDHAHNEITKFGVKCENLLIVEDISYKYLLLKYWEFFRYIRKKSFDIIHYHQGGIGILLLAFFFRKNAKVIHHLHSGNLIGDNTKQSISFLHLIILKYLSTRTRQIAVAKHVFDEYATRIKTTQNLKRIRNSQPFPFKKKESRTNSIGYIGRFTKEKGFISLLNISVNLREKYPDLKILLMGGETELSDKVLSHTNLSIELINPSIKVEKFYQSIDLLLFLSTAPEGMPMVILEALSFDIGVIAFPISGVVEILGNDYPLYIKSSEEVIEKLQLYYSNKINRKELSQIHETVSKKHSFEEMLKAIKQLYSECLNS